MQIKPSYFSLQVCLVSGSYIVEVNVHNYQNPSGRCDGCQAGNDPGPGCCDEDFVRPLNQACPSSGPDVICDTFIAYCSVPHGDPTCDPITEGSYRHFSDLTLTVLTLMLKEAYLEQNSL